MMFSRYSDYCIITAELINTANPIWYHFLSKLLIETCFLVAANFLRIQC